MKVLRILNLSGSQITEEDKKKIEEKYRDLGYSFDSLEIIDFNGDIRLENIEQLVKDSVEKFFRGGFSLFKFDGIIPPNSLEGIYLFAKLNDIDVLDMHAFFIILKEDFIDIVVTHPCDDDS